MKVFFSDRAYASVLAETTEKIATETGGLFLGAVIDDTWYIIEAIDPGPKSIFEVAYFEYDKQYTQHLINKVANLYDKKLDVIGLWHRHPGSFDQFSSTDNGTNTKYAAMRKHGAISALVNIDPSFRITMYHVGQPCKYSKIVYEVGDRYIPDELLKFKTPDRFFEIMDSLLHSDVSTHNGEYHKSVSLSSFMKFILPVLQAEKVSDFKANNLTNRKEIQERLIDELIDDLTFMADEIGVETSIALNEGILSIYQEAIDKTTKLFFMFSESKNSVVFSYENTFYSYHQNLFFEAYKRAKIEHDKISSTALTSQARKQNGVIESFVRIIKFDRDEE